MTSLFNIDSPILYALGIYLSGVLSGIIFIALSVITYCGWGHSIILSNDKSCLNLIERLTSLAMGKPKVLSDPSWTLRVFTPMFLRIMGQTSHHSSPSRDHGRKCGMRLRLKLLGYMSGLHIGDPFIFHTGRKNIWMRGGELCFGFLTTPVLEPFSFMGITWVKNIKRLSQTLVTLKESIFTTSLFI